MLLLQLKLEFRCHPVHPENKMLDILLPAYIYYLKKPEIEALLLLPVCLDLRFQLGADFSVNEL